MGTYLVTGSASGIGAATATALRAAGYEVIGVDRDGEPEVTADLSGAAGRGAAIARITALLAGRALDGAVFAAGVGGMKGREALVAEVNCLGVTEILSALRPALARAGNAKVVVFGSNSTTATPFVSSTAVRRLMAGDVERAVRIIRRRGPVSAEVAYATSKVAVTWWAREKAVSDEWAGVGIRINVIAPGPVMTPLLRGQLDGPASKSVRSFPVPIRAYGTPEQVAAWVLSMLAPQADLLVGAVITVDGGTEALLRTREWPRPLPLLRMPKMLFEMYRAPKRGRVARY